MVGERRLGGALRPHHPRHRLPLDALHQRPKVRVFGVLCVSVRSFGLISVVAAAAAAAVVVIAAVVVVGWLMLLFLYCFWCFCFCCCCRRLRFLLLLLLLLWLLLLFLLGLTNDDNLEQCVRRTQSATDEYRYAYSKQLKTFDPDDEDGSGDDDYDGDDDDIGVEMMGNDHKVDAEYGGELDDGDGYDGGGFGSGGGAAAAVVGGGREEILSISEAITGTKQATGAEKLT